MGILKFLRKATGQDMVTNRPKHQKGKPAAASGLNRPLTQKEKFAVAVYRRIGKAFWTVPVYIKHGEKAFQLDVTVIARSKWNAEKQAEMVARRVIKIYAGKAKKIQPPKNS